MINYFLMKLMIVDNALPNNDKNNYPQNQDLKKYFEVSDAIKPN